MAEAPSPTEILWQEKHINDDKVPTLIAANAVCFTVACIAVVLRFLARRKAKVNYGLVDWLIVVGWV